MKYKIIWNIKFVIIILPFFVYSQEREEIPPYSSVESSFQEDLSNIRKYGLVSYLTFVKYKSENILAIRHQNYEKFNKAIKSSKEKNDSLIGLRKENYKESLNDYFNIKLNVDMLLNQLSVEMIDSNRMKGYRELDEKIKSWSKDGSFYVKEYEIIDFIDQIETSYLRLMVGRQNENKPPGLSSNVEILTPVVELGYSIISGERDARNKKVMATLNLLNELKLASVKDILKPKNEEK